jgi:Flp pilus assembly pilin Flp
MWLWLDKSFDEIIPFMQKVVSDKEILSITTALIVITWPVGIIIGKITGPFRNELKMNDSLSKAGLYIGTAERILVFVFILIGQYEAIGFLIASKSILRITKDDDKDGRKKTEYVLIGTLISFTIAIVVGLLVKQIIKMP